MDVHIALLACCKHDRHLVVNLPMVCPNLSAVGFIAADSCTFRKHQGTVIYKHGLKRAPGVTAQMLRKFQFATYYTCCFATQITRVRLW